LGLTKEKNKENMPLPINTSTTTPAAPSPTSRFAGLKNAQVTVRTPKLTEGRYLVRVKSATWKSVRVPVGSFKFFLEFKVEQSNRPDIIERFATESAADYEARLAKAPTAVGTTAAWGQSCADPAVGFGALKGFLANITGQNPEDPAFCDQVEGLLEKVVQENALEGSLLPVETQSITTTKGFPFVKHTWGREVDESGE